MTKFYFTLPNYAHLRWLKIIRIRQLQRVRLLKKYSNLLLYTIVGNNYEQIKYSLLLIFTISNLQLIAQDTLDFNDIYIENELVYKHSDDERFTGVVQRKRKNGHLKYQQEYKDGVILVYYQYYNGKGNNLSHKTIYNRYKLWVEEKEYFYAKAKDWTQTTFFDGSGKKLLVEQYKKDSLFYRCEYSNGKKMVKKFAMKTMEKK